MLKLSAIGNIGKDAEIRKNGNDTVINFSVAVNKKFNNAQGVAVETTTWLECALWRRGDQSTDIAQYLKAGVKVYVEGEPTARAYVNGQNQAAASQVVKVSLVELLSPKKEEAPVVEKPKPGDLPASTFDNEASEMNADKTKAGKKAAVTA